MHHHGRPRSQPAGATHVITGIRAGAMSFLAGAGTESSAGIGAAGAS